MNVNISSFLNSIQAKNTLQIIPDLLHFTFKTERATRIEYGNPLVYSMLSFQNNSKTKVTEVKHTRSGCCSAEEKRFAKTESFVVDLLLWLHCEKHKCHAVYQQERL